MIEKLFEDYLDILQNSNSYLYNHDKENLSSFIKGYSKGCRNSDFTDYLSSYLYYNYKINIDHNTWHQQVDHYSYIKGLEWFDGFFALLIEVLEKRQELSIISKMPSPNFLHEIPKGKLQKFIRLEDGTTFRIGDFIQLADIIGEDYKQTKFYDASLRNPSWDLFYPSEKDFQYIYFYHEKNRYFEENTDHLITLFGKVRRLLSGSIVEIKKLAIQDDEIIIYTDLFRINAERAIQAQEIKILNQQNHKLTPTNLFNLVDKIQQHELGLYPSDELTKTVNDWSFFCIKDLQKEWHKYAFNMRGRWYKKI